MLFLSLLDRKEQPGAAAVHLWVLPGTMPRRCRPRELQPAATARGPSLPSGQGQGLSSSKATQCELPGVLCPAPCHGPVPSRGLEGHTGRQEPGSELLPRRLKQLWPLPSAGSTLGLCWGRDPWPQHRQRGGRLASPLVPLALRSSWPLQHPRQSTRKPPQSCRAPRHRQNHLGLKTAKTRQAPKSLLRQQEPQDGPAPTGRWACGAGTPAGREHRDPKSSAGQKPGEPTPHQLGLDSPSLHRKGRWETASAI